MHRAFCFFFAIVASSATLPAQETGTWRQLPVPKPPVAKYQFIDFADSVNGWVVTSDGYFSLTTNGGRSWREPKCVGSVERVDKVKLYDASTGIIVSSPVQSTFQNPARLSLTTDGGTSWRSFLLPDTMRGWLPSSIVNRNVIGFVGFEHAIASHILYTST